MKPKTIKVIPGDLFGGSPALSQIDNLKFVNKDGDKYVATITQEKQYDKLADTIASMIADMATAHFMGKVLKDKFPKSQVTSVINNHITSHQESHYFSRLTRIMLDNYFSMNAKINLTAYIMFNAYGMRKELIEIANTEFEMGGKFVQPCNNIDIPIAKLETFASGCSLDEAIRIARENLIKSGCSQDIVETIFVGVDAGEIVLKNRRKDTLNQEFLEKHIGLTLDFQMSNGREQGQMTMLVILMEVFHPQKIYIFSDVPESFSHVIIENVKIFNKGREGEEIEIYRANKPSPKW